MRIGGLIKSSCMDSPRRKAAMVLLQGCNMRCPYCHDPSLVVPACFNEPLDEDHVISYLKRHRRFLDAVVVSGGEPTIHKDLPDFMMKIHAFGLPITLETNGTNPDMIRELLHLGLLNFIAMDVKAPLEEYIASTGCRIKAEAIKASIWIIKHSGVDHEFRTTVVPGLHTVPELKEIANLVRGANRYVLQAFRSTTCLRQNLQGRPAFKPEVFEDERPFFQRRVKNFELRGYDTPVTATT